MPQDADALRGLCNMHTQKRTSSTCHGRHQCPQERGHGDEVRHALGHEGVHECPGIEHHLLRNQQALDSVQTTTEA